MHTVLFALTRHFDIANLELEDGLVRGAAAELLAAPSTISQVSVDVATAASVDLDARFSAPHFDTLFRITGDTTADTRPTNLAELTAEVANIVGAWSLQTVTIAERKDDWIGTATPGVKLVALLVRGPGIDTGSYTGWLRDELLTCADDLDGVGISYNTPDETIAGTMSFDTLVEFSFPSHDVLTETLEARRLQPILGSQLLADDETIVFTAVEHLLTPNENAWEMHDSSPTTPEG